MVKLSSKGSDPLHTPARRCGFLALPETLAIVNFVITNLSGWI